MVNDNKIYSRGTMDGCVYIVYCLCVCEGMLFMCVCTWLCMHVWAYAGCIRKQTSFIGSDCNSSE